MSPFQSDRFGGSQETVTAVALSGIAVRLVTGAAGAKIKKQEWHHSIMSKAIIATTQTNDNSSATMSHELTCFQSCFCFDGRSS